MSNETWHFSFAKYLELRFHGNAYYRRQMSATDTLTLACACSHPLHTEHFHYFGCRDLVASFKFTPITLKEISLSPVSICIGQESELLPRLVEGIRLVAQCGYGLHAVITEWLSALMPECTATKLETSIAHLIEQQVGIFISHIPSPYYLYLIPYHLIQIYRSNKKNLIIIRFSRNSFKFNIQCTVKYQGSINKSLRI